VSGSKAVVAAGVDVAVGGAGAVVEAGAVLVAARRLGVGSQTGRYEERTSAGMSMVTGRQDSLAG